MHKIYTTVDVSHFREDITGIPYTGLSFEMAKERSNYGSSSKIEVWLEGVHIETYMFRRVKGEGDKYEWQKTYDRKEKLEEQIRKANLELDALTAAHILLQEEN